MHVFFQDNLDFVYFIYGGAFFFAGLAILIQSHNESDIELSSVITWLGVFGVLHGFNEWWGMWKIIKVFPESIQIIGPFILLFSYIPLFEFGRRALSIYSQKKECQAWPASLLRPWIYAPLLGIVFLGGLTTPGSLDGIALFSRYTFGMLGALLTGFVFLCSLHIYRDEISNLGCGISFYLTGIAFLLYALLGGVIGPEAGFFPASVVNAKSFLMVVHVPVQLFRAACAVAVLVGISSILRLFRIEIFQKLKAEEEEVIQLNNDLDRRIKERTAQLEAANRELKEEITERKYAVERMTFLAYHDDLTGLPNRSLFQDRLQQAIARAKRQGTKIGVLLLDVERLKAVNDSLGHVAGDTLLREIGGRIGRVIRDNDTVARISGDEFMIIAEDIEYPDQIMKLGSRIRKAVNHPLDLMETRIYPDCSIGFSVYPDDATETYILLRKTDMAMYEAKKSAFAKVQGFVGQEDWITKQFYLEHELKAALEHGQFIIYYQPQVDLKSRQLIGLEALLRWQHPAKGLVSPGEFVPVLEKTGIITYVGEWVLRTACKQLKSWQQCGFYHKVAVNISAQQLDGDQLIRTIRENLQQTGIEAKYLEIELTETVLMQNISQATHILDTITGWGGTVALDDFGKGYSCLSYLQQLSLDCIKLDMQFVRTLPESKEDMVLAQTIVEMAHNLGKKTLAEGVEREEQVQALQKMGCDYAQGFLFGRPMPAEQIAEVYLPQEVN